MHTHLIYSSYEGKCNKHCPYSVAEASVATLQEMNPLVKVSVQQGAVSTQDLRFVQAYQVSTIIAVTLMQLTFACVSNVCCTSTKVAH